MSWKDYFDNSILNRGYDYYKRDNIISLRYNDDNSVEAKVAGTRTYHVYIDMEDLQGMECSCPHYKEGNYCKHLAAVMYAVENEDKSYNENDFFDYDEYDEYDDFDDEYDYDGEYEERVYQQSEDIDKMVNECDIDVLRSFLKSSLKSNSSLLSKFVTETSSYTTHTLNIYSNELDSILDCYQNDYGYIDYEDSFDFGKDITRFIDNHIFKLVQENRYSDAFELTTQLFEKTQYLEIDDSNGVLSLISDNVINIWQYILNNCIDKKVIDHMFRGLYIN